jgi:hypothetical protein
MPVSPCLCLHTYLLVVYCYRLLNFKHLGTGTGAMCDVQFVIFVPREKTTVPIFDLYIYTNQPKNRTVEDETKVTMKFLFSVILLSSLPSSSVVVEGGKTVGVMHTCEQQGRCLQVTVNEIAPDCGSDTCEYQVCWQQLEAGVGRGCRKYGDVAYIGDMHKYKYGEVEYTEDGGCLNEANADGKGFWDNTCTVPDAEQFGYSGGENYTSTFKYFCQTVSPGHTAHILINDGAECTAGVASMFDATGKGLTATCGNSTSDSGAVGGQTYFPVEGVLGGTCSTEDEGYDCVWSITVPQVCYYEEHPAAACETEYIFNDEHICPPDGSILEYYPNDANPAPPVVKGGPIIHDLTHIDTTEVSGEITRTVSFRVMSPYRDMVDIYTVYHSAENGDSICNKDESLLECPSEVVMKAMCFEDDSWTVVTVFVAGYGPDSETAADVFGAGTEIYECCDTTFSPVDHTHAEYITGYTYLIRCKCEDELAVEGGRRVLQVSDDLSRRFLAGELFDDELKAIYGLN